MISAAQQAASTDIEVKDDSANDPPRHLRESFSKIREAHESSLWTQDTSDSERGPISCEAQCHANMHASALLVDLQWWVHTHDLREKNQTCFRDGK